MIVNVDLNRQDSCPVLAHSLLRQVHSPVLFGVDGLVWHVHRLSLSARKDHIISNVEFLRLLLHKLFTVKGLTLQLQATVIVLIRTLGLFIIYFKLTDRVIRRLIVLHAHVQPMQMSCARVAEVMSQVELAYLLVVVLKGEA